MPLTCIDPSCWEKVPPQLFTICTVSLSRKVNRQSSILVWLVFCTVIVTMAPPQNGATFERTEQDTGAEVGVEVGVEIEGDTVGVEVARGRTTRSMGTGVVGATVGGRPRVSGTDTEGSGTTGGVVLATEVTATDGES